MKFVPGGISKKSGNPYNGFYGCSDKECKESVNIPEKLGRLMTMEHQYTKDKVFGYGGACNRANEWVDKTVSFTDKKEQFEEAYKYFMEHFKEFYMKEVVLEEDPKVEELKAKLEKE